MSDTSIGASDYENDYSNRRGSCWSRFGANLCAGICTISTIILAIALLYLLYDLRKLGTIKGKKGGKQASSLFFNPFGGYGGGSSNDNDDAGGGDDGNIEDYIEE